jgi:hypothetical protein
MQLKYFETSSNFRFIIRKCLLVRVEQPWETDIHRIKHAPVLCDDLPGPLLLHCLPTRPFPPSPHRKVTLVVLCDDLPGPLLLHCLPTRPSPHPPHRQVTLFVLCDDLPGLLLLSGLPTRPSPPIPFRQVTLVDCVMTYLSLCFFAVYLPDPLLILHTERQPCLFCVAMATLAKRKRTKASIIAFFSLAKRSERVR